MISIYVGNLPYDTTRAELTELFSEYGEVLRATIVTHSDTGRSRGFGFIEMESEDEGHAAIDALAGSEALGRPLTVNEARPRGSGTGQRIIGSGAPREDDERDEQRDEEAPRRRDAPLPSPQPHAEPIHASAGYHNRFRAAM